VRGRAKGSGSGDGSGGPWSRSKKKTRMEQGGEPGYGTHGAHKKNGGQTGNGLVKRFGEGVTAKQRTNIRGRLDMCRKKCQTPVVGAKKNVVEGLPSATDTRCQVNVEVDRDSTKRYVKGGKKVDWDHRVAQHPGQYIQGRDPSARVGNRSPRKNGVGEEPPKGEKNSNSVKLVRRKKTQTTGDKKNGNTKGGQTQPRQTTTGRF